VKPIRNEPIACFRNPASNRAVLTLAKILSAVRAELALVASSLLANISHPNMSCGLPLSCGMISTSCTERPSGQSAHAWTTEFLHTRPIGGFRKHLGFLTSWLLEETMNLH
jgi:hypothetical protein